MIFPARVVAISAPYYPSCASPQGTLKVHYSSGIHGIVGSSATYQGSDTVYQVNGSQVMQCYCAGDSSGIQTNWWRVSDLGENEIDTFVRTGWVLIPNGSLWGLEESPYLAINSSFSCSGKGGANSTAITSYAGTVLGLADTGYMRQNIFTGISGLFILSGVVLFFKRKKFLSLTE